MSRLVAIVLASLILSLTVSLIADGYIRMPGLENDPQTFTLVKRPGGGAVTYWIEFVKGTMNITTIVTGLDSGVPFEEAHRLHRIRVDRYEAAIAPGPPVAAPAPAAAAAPGQAAFCAPGQRPGFQAGFAALKAQLGETMGDPVECEHTNPQNGDSLQNTTRGLAFYRKSTNTPTFTNGDEHWAITPRGLVYWTGSSVDPPSP